MPYTLSQKYKAFSDLYLIIFNTPKNLFTQFIILIVLNIKSKQRQKCPILFLKSTRHFRTYT